MFEDNDRYLRISVKCNFIQNIFKLKCRTHKLLLLK